MTTARKKLLIEQPNNIYLKYLSLAMEFKEKYPDKWTHLSDDELASLIYENSQHKETYYED
jgi:hypothetical protein